MNCFDCDGLEKVCSHYHKSRNYDKCMYRLVADNDLKKHNEGNLHITLYDMLMDYLKQEENK